MVGQSRLKRQAVVANNSEESLGSKVDRRSDRHRRKRCFVGPSGFEAEIRDACIGSAFAEPTPHSLSSITSDQRHWFVGCNLHRPLGSSLLKGASLRNAAMMDRPRQRVAPSALVAAKDVEQIDRLVAGGHASGTEARQRVPCVWLHPDNVDEAAKRGDLTRCVRDQRCVSAAEGKRGRSSLSWLPAAITPAISVTSTRVAVTTDPVAAISVDGGRANTTVRAADQSNALDV